MLNLPDCPNCIRSVRLTTESVIGAKLQADTVVLLTRSGEQCFPLEQIIRHRINWAYALDNHYLIIDLRGSDAEPPIPRSFPLSAERIALLPEAYPADMRLAFVAGNEETADRMADLFIRHGRSMARSLGSIQELFFSK